MKERILMYFQSAPKLPEHITIAPGLTIWDVPGYIAANLLHLSKDPENAGTFENLIEIYHHLTYYHEPAN